MLEIVTLTLFVIGLGGTLFIVFRRLPEVRLISESKVAVWSFPDTVKQYRKIVVSFVIEKVESFSWDLMIQTALSRVRVVVLKIDTRIASRLSTMRERSKKQKEREDYWKRISGLVKEE